MILPRVADNNRSSDNKKVSLAMDNIIPQNLNQCAFDFDALSSQPIEPLFHTSSGPTDNPQIKFCTKCSQYFPATFEYFYRNKNTKDGFQVPCKACRKEYATEHKEHRKAYTVKYRQEHAEGIKAKKHQDYQSNKYGAKEQMDGYRKEHREVLSSYSRRYRQEHREDCKAYLVRYRQENREAWNAYSRRYHQEHQEQCREKSRKYSKTPKGRLIDNVKSSKRRAAKLASKGSYTTEQIQEKMIRQGHKCYYCQIRLKKEKGRYIFHHDHIVPLSRGGSNNIDNIAIACPTCNLKKSDKLLHEWLDGCRLI
jgi:5-methylcytosine-specific restriction endonuclease McrA